MGEAPKVIRFGTFEVDLAAAELRKQGLKLRLQEQPFQILAALLEHPGEVVTREDLIARLWPDGTIVDFDCGLNAAVTRLRQVLSDSAETPRYVETVARRGYRFIASVEARTREEALPSAVSPRRPAVWLAISGVMLILLAGAAFFWLAREPSNSLPIPRPITSYDGHEKSPSFSPDGSQVAFSWQRDKSDNFDIYVQVLGGTSPLRLTSDAASDVAPAWSPDGRQIAFQRVGKGIYLVPPTGGVERKLTEDPVGNNFWFNLSRQLCWSVDGHRLVFAKAPDESSPAGIFSIDVQGGSIRRITAAKAPVVHQTPAISPDGQTLAFAACSGNNACDLVVVPIDPELGTKGPIQVVSSRTDIIMSMAWFPDGREVAFSANAGFDSSMWRVALRAGSEAKLLSFAPLRSEHPAFSRTGHRMAFSEGMWNQDLWVWKQGSWSKSPISSTFPDDSPKFSPDGHQVAFASARSGTQQVWKANLDGSQPVQLTEGRISGTPNWSPDGRRIVYDSQSPNGFYRIQILDLGGGPPQIVPLGAQADDKIPSYSHDGSWIYFTSNRTGKDESFRVPTTGGDPVRLTVNGGRVGIESVDGKSIYYSKSSYCGLPLFQRSMQGGPERVVLDSVCGRAFVVTERGIYYTNAEEGLNLVTLRPFDPKTGKSHQLGRSDRRLATIRGMTVSPDGSTILVSANERWGADLMMVENFR